MLPRTCLLMIIAAALAVLSAPALADPVNTPPVADANGPYETTLGTPVTFDGSGSWDPDMTDILSYDWTFGDGNTGTGIYAIHTYALPGFYTITLWVTDNNGGTGVATTTARITEAPPIPEPGSLALVGLAGLGLIWFRRRRRLG